MHMHTPSPLACPVGSTKGMVEDAWTILIDANQPGAVLLVDARV
jgi:hypothetical protein